MIKIKKFLYNGDNIGMKFLNPKQIISSLPILPGQKIADFGSGSGYFAIILAQTIAPNGVVYAIDVVPETLDALKSKAKSLGLFNIEYVKGDLEKEKGSTLDNESVDSVLISNVLFQSQNKEKILKEATRILRTGGNLIIIEWFPNMLPYPNLFPIQPEELKKLCHNSGFGFVRNFDAGAQHYGMIFKK